MDPLIAILARFAKLTEYQLLADAYRRSYSNAWRADSNKSRRDRMAVLYKELWPDE